jgi:hypothetical protein
MTGSTAHVIADIATVPFSEGYHSPHQDLNEKVLIRVSGKAPMSTASKAPAKSTEGVKATKKTRDDAPADGEKKKRKKVRKETYSSYIYKGKFFNMQCLIVLTTTVLIVLKQVHPDMGISKCITMEAYGMLHVDNHYILII